MALTLSERRQVAVEDDDRQLAVAVSAGGAGRWDWDLRSGVVTWSKAQAALFGQAEAAFGGSLTDWLALVHPEDRVGLSDRLHRCAELQVVFDHTYRTLAADGSVRWVLSRGRLLTRAGDPRHMTGLSLDVTASRQEGAGAERLLAVSVALAAVMEPSEVVWAVLSLGLAPLGLIDGQVVGAGRTGWLTVLGQTPGSVVLDGAVRDRSLVQAVAASGVPVLPLPASGPRNRLDGGPQSVPVCLPLQTGGRTIGVLSARLPAGVVLGPADQQVLLLLAGLCAQALDRAVLHVREAEVGRTLQRQLLPARLPEMAGVELAGRYLAGTQDLTVGGDWYDAMPGDGEVALVLGDVVGKGLAAASLMSRARHTVNAYALLDSSPAAVLAATDRLAESVLEDSQIVTVMYAVLTTADGSFLHASAGHPPPLVVGPGPTAQFLSVEAQPPLGAGWGPWKQQQAVLPAGAVLLMYSDGLIELRGRDLQEGMDELQSAAAALYQGPGMPLEELCDALIERVLRGARPDDVTLLAARLRPRPAGPNGLASAGLIGAIGADGALADGAP